MAVEASGISPALIALIGTLFGGVGFKIIEHILSNSAKKDTAAKEIRTELREDARSLREQLKECNQKIEELDREIEVLVELKFKQAEQISELRIQLAESIANIKNQAEIAKKQVEKLPDINGRV